MELIRTAKTILFKEYGNTLSLKEMRRIDFHLSQSFYVLNFLKKKKFINYYYLGDYLSSNYYNLLPKPKEDIVCYNPKKGIIFTKKIIDYCKDIKFVPIENMTNNQVTDLLCKSKIYIDFGFHPGKDRLPREAVLCGCCILTSQRGAAKNKLDIPIKQKYKIKDKRTKLKKIDTTIKYILNNFEECVDDFASFKEMILTEEKEFSKNIKNIFKRIKAS